MLQRSLRQLPLSLFLCAVLFAGLFGCTPQGNQTKQIAADPSILRVGVTSDAPPLVYRRNNTVVGLEADFAKGLGKFTGKRVEFIEVDRDKKISSLLNDEIDIIMSAMSITDARQYQIAFTAPYLRSGQILLVRLKDKAKFSTGIYSLMNSSYVIGTIKNTTGDLFITKTINGVKVKQFKTTKKAVQALITEEIDALVYDAPMVCHFAAVNENQKLAPILALATEEYLAWGIRKEDTELLQQANAYLQSLKDKNELHRMIRTRIPYM
jgi:polar amino acid transport system substrate-binding protein